MQNNLRVHDTEIWKVLQKDILLWILHFEVPKVSENKRDPALCCISEDQRGHEHSCDESLK